MELDSVFTVLSVFLADTRKKELDHEKVTHDDGSNFTGSVR